MALSLLLTALAASHLGATSTKDNARPSPVVDWVEAASRNCGTELICLGARYSLVNSSMAKLIEDGCSPNGDGCSETQSLVLIKLKGARDSIETERQASDLILTFEQLQSASLEEGRLRSVIDEWILTAQTGNCNLSARLCDTGRLWLLAEADTAARSLPKCNLSSKLGCWSDPTTVRTAIDARIAPIRSSFFQRVYWPESRSWGESAANAAWLLVQHADTDLAFQRDILESLNSFRTSSDADKRRLAMLTDRVAVASGLDQVYGTQGRCSVDGWQMFAVIDEANLDRRRAELGMSSIEEYKSQVSHICKE